MIFDDASPPKPVRTSFCPGFSKFLNPAAVQDSQWDIFFAILAQYLTFINKSMDKPSPEQLRQRLETLKTEHRDLDDVIVRLVDSGPYDQLQMQRLKKRKLRLKDEILKVEDELFPDIIA